MVAAVDGRTLISRWRPADAHKVGLFDQQFEDWLFHALLPLVAYAMLARAPAEQIRPALRRRAPQFSRSTKSISRERFSS